MAKDVIRAMTAILKDMGREIPKPDIKEHIGMFEDVITHIDIEL